MQSTTLQSTTLQSTTLQSTTLQSTTLQSTTLSPEAQVHPGLANQALANQALAPKVAKVGRGKNANRWGDYEWVTTIPFIAVHLAAFGALWTGTRWQDWACCALLFWARMFGVTGGYHRYFAHRTYKTSRFMQFCLALLAQSSAQRGVLWWAAHHRRHHLYSDTERDVHSPQRWGFLYSHCGWLFDNHNPTDYRRIRDISGYPELRWLNKYFLVPPFLLALGVWLLLGWSGLWIGFMLSTVITWHATFSINSLMHVIGKQRFKTSDTSRNHWALALLTMGEGWHNNHHYYKDSVRQGFRWWEIDMSYYIIRTLGWLGLVWDIQEPPKRILEEAARLPLVKVPSLAAVRAAVQAVEQPVAGPVA